MNKLKQWIFAAIGSYLKRISANGTRSYRLGGVHFLIAADVKRLFPEAVTREGQSESYQVPALEMNRSGFLLEGAESDPAGLFNGYEVQLAAPFSARFVSGEQCQLFAASGCLLLRDKQRGAFVVCPEMTSSQRVASVFRSVSSGSVPSFAAISSWKSTGFGDFMLLMLPKMARIAGAKENGRLMFSNPPPHVIQYSDLFQLERPISNTEFKKLIPIREFAEVIFGPGVDDGFVPLRSDLDRVLEMVVPRLSKSPLKKIYFCREGRRKITNEQELLPLFQQLGFEIIRDNHTNVLEQAALFRGADVIVSPHGALMANFTYCRPGTVVVELFPGAFGAICYRSLAKIVGLNYHAVFCTKLTSFRNDAVHVDFPVDAGRLMDAIKSILNR